MPITRDWINPILKNAPKGIRPRGYLGGALVALLAALNPFSYFTRPYFGAVSWLILTWWFYNENPMGIIRPRDPEKKTLFKGNPKWYQTIKSFGYGLLFNPIPMFTLYFILLVLSRIDAKLGVKLN